nr:TonB-dependent receptor [Parerythrobacter aestuarii]
MIDRKYWAAGISGLAMALTLAPQAAMAQDADSSEEAAADETGDGNVIIVSGFRASLESAVAEKKLNDQILESVTAEDIGKLPDNSIGESIARLPGVTSQRLSGRANVIAIRGFGQDFSQTLLNGREQTSLGDARAVEFDQYPSEVVQQVVVYKTPTAELVGQGLVGTIDIRTLRPLDIKEPIFAIGARGSLTDLGALNAGSKELGYRVNATFADTFADDTFGVAISASYVDESYQLQEFNAWGYAGGPNNSALIGGSKSFVTSTQLKRFGISGTVQWAPAPDWSVTGDVFYSDFEDDQIKRGVELPLGFCVNPGDPLNRNSAFCFGATADPASFQYDNDTVVAGNFPTVEGVVRNDIFNKEAELLSGGLNIEYDGDNGWSGYFDFGYSRTDRRELSFESYAGTGVGALNGATDNITFVTGPTGTSFTSTLNYADPNIIVLTDPLGWGGGTQAGYFNDRIVDDELLQFRFHVEKAIEGGFISAIKAGMNYTNRDKSLVPDEYFIRLAGGALEAPIPADLLLDPTDLTYLGLGPMVSYDPRALIANGTYVLDPNLSNDIPAKAYQIAEDLMTIYVQADIDVRLGNADLTGNIGVQAINTDQQSSGIAFPGGVQTNVSLGDSYWDVLPSLNLSLRFDSDFVIRLGASRQIQRPRLDSMRAAIGYGLDFNQGASPTGTAPFINGGGGNPYLRPYRANAVDLTFEKYFGTSGVIAAQFFYKDIVSYIDQNRFVFDYAGLPLPAGPVPPSTIGLLDAPTNTGGGDFYGAELALTFPFDMVTPALEGFGFTGGLGWTETKIEDAFGNVDQIPGYSEWVANGTLYFEKDGFNARSSVRHRSGFLGDFTGFGGSPTRRNALSETIIDAQLGYDFDGGPLDGLSIYVQGQNLTDEPFVSINGNGNPLQVVDYQSYGRRFLAGFTYRFR